MTEFFPRKPLQKPAFSYILTPKITRSEMEANAKMLFTFIVICDSIQVVEIGIYPKITPKTQFVDYIQITFVLVHEFIVFYQLLIHPMVCWFKINGRTETLIKSFYQNQLFISVFDTSILKSYLRRLHTKWQKKFSLWRPFCVTRTSL